MNKSEKYSGKFMHPTFNEWSYNIRDIITEHKDTDRMDFCQSIVDDIVGDLIWADTIKSIDKVRNKWVAIALRHPFRSFSYYIQELKDELKDKKIMKCVYPHHNTFPIMKDELKELLIMNEKNEINELWKEISRQIKTNQSINERLSALETNYNNIVTQLSLVNERCQKIENRIKNLETKFNDLYDDKKIELNGFKVRLNTQEEKLKELEEKIRERWDDQEINVLWTTKIVANENKLRKLNDNQEAFAKFTERYALNKIETDKRIKEVEQNYKTHRDCITGFQIQLGNIEAVLRSEIENRNAYLRTMILLAPRELGTEHLFCIQETIEKGKKNIEKLGSEDVSLKKILKKGREEDKLHEEQLARQTEEETSKCWDCRYFIHMVKDCRYVNKEECIPKGYKYFEPREQSSPAEDFEEDINELPFEDWDDIMQKSAYEAGYKRAKEELIAEIINEYDSFIGKIAIYRQGVQTIPKIRMMNNLQELLDFAKNKKKDWEARQK